MQAIFPRLDIICKSLIAVSVALLSCSNYFQCLTSLLFFNFEDLMQADQRSERIRDLNLKIMPKIGGVR